MIIKEKGHDFDDPRVETILKLFRAYLLDPPIGGQERPIPELPQWSLEDGDISRAIEDYLQGSITTLAPGFMNQLLSKVTPPALLADILLTLTNTTMATLEMSPMATQIEEQMIEMMGRIAGLPQTYGQFVPGGSLANLIGLQCAREWAFPGSSEHGPSHYTFQRPVVLCSNQAHYSVAKALQVLGLGRAHVREVESLPNGQLCLESLKLVHQECLKNHERPFALVATAGTTVAGAIDPLEEMGVFAKENRLWFHVDACYGGALLFSDQLRLKLHGLHLCDSLAFDAHKALGASLPCSLFLTTNQDVLSRACGRGGESYLFQQHEGRDSGRSSILCGRKNDGLKLWLSWLWYGQKGLGERVETCHRVAQMVHQKLGDVSSIESFISPETFNLCLHSEIETLQWRKNILATSRYHVNYAHWKNKLILRPVFVDSNWNEEMADDFIRVMQEATHQTSAAFFAVP